VTRILVVEDDETIAAAIGERLRSEGFAPPRSALQHPTHDPFEQFRLPLR
jgi:DNA-binding response OmpR family regulator